MEAVHHAIQIAGDCYEWLGPRNAAGYGRVYLTAQSRIMVTRAVWEAANGPIPPGLHILHSCDNPPCIRLTHLRLGSLTENNQDRVSRDRNGRLCGEANPNARLTADDVRRIRERVAHGEGQRSVGVDYGIGQAAVSRIVLGHNWAQIEPHSCAACTALVKGKR